MTARRPKNDDARDDKDPRSDAAPPSWTQRITAEVFGTFVLVLVAGGGDVLAQSHGQIVDHLSRYAAPGLVVMALIYALGECSGAHLNPAVTFGFALRRDIEWLEAVPYVAAQLAGALLASGALYALFGDQIHLAVVHPGAEFAAWQAFAAEVVLTTLLIFVIFGTAASAKIVGPNAAIAVGATIALCGIFASPVSGASLNPARALAPMIVASQLRDWWLYACAPFAGAAIAAVLTYVVHGSPSTEEREAGRGRRRR